MLHPESHHLTFGVRLLNRLLKHYVSEIFRTVEVGVGRADRVPRQEVRGREFVSALVEVAARLYA